MIVAEHVTKYYGAHRAVDDVSFRIDRGQVVGLLGLNGAGKSTTLRILSGLVPPTSGTVRIGDIDLAKSPAALRTQVGFLPETPPLYGEMRVRDYLAFVARIKGVRGSLKAVLHRALEATDLTERAEARIDTLSFGFRRRVGIAQAVVHAPPLILLDEPTAGLDPVQIVHMRRLIRGLGRDHTVIVSSHVLGEIHALCDRIFVLQRGRIAAVGSEASLAERLGPRTTALLEVRATEPALQRLLEERVKVRAYTLEALTGGWQRARVELDSDNREALAAACIEAGFGLRRLERVELELERIFLALTDGGAPPKETSA